MKSRQSIFSAARVINVTPLAGVWIEMSGSAGAVQGLIVTPLAGVWIEIGERCWNRRYPEVTPLAGVWIEIYYLMKYITKDKGHTPRGCVD